MEAMTSIDIKKALGHTRVMVRTLPVPLDDDSHRALLTIEDSGQSVAEFVRRALIKEAQRLRSPEVQHAEFLAASIDPEDALALKDTFDFLESLDDPR